MPVDWKRYPANWKEIVARIRERSGDKCEWCGAINRAWVIRPPAPAPLGSFFYVTGPDDVCKGVNPVEIILTTAHLGTPHPDGRPGDKHDKHDTRDENLAHLCQRCHLLYDLDDHVRNAAVTRRRKKIELGFTEMDL